MDIILARSDCLLLIKLLAISQLSEQDFSLSRPALVHIYFLLSMFDFYIFTTQRQLSESFLLPLAVIEVCDLDREEQGCFNVGGVETMIRWRACVACSQVDRVEVGGGSWWW